LQIELLLGEICGKNVKKSPKSAQSTCFLIDFDVQFIFVKLYLYGFGSLQKVHLLRKECALGRLDRVVSSKSLVYLKKWRRTK